MVRFLVVLGVLVTSVGVFAAEPTSAPASRPSDPAAQTQDLLACFNAGRYSEAAALARKMVAANTNDPYAHYNLACALSRLGEVGEGLRELRASVERGNVNIGHMLDDADLANLQKEVGFIDVLKLARRKQIEAARPKYEKGQEIAGIKTVDGNPQNGLRYRLRISPDATKAKPARLVVWLHPTGGSLNNSVESLAPMLARHGLALLVFTQKDWNGWTTQDVAALGAALKDVGKIEGLDASRPILMGFSAGGQLALLLWGRDPLAFSGLVLDAAYPLDQAQYMQGKVAVMGVPKGDVTKCPILALVGGNDDGRRLWAAAMPDYVKAGVPVTIHTVPGRGHAYLLDSSTEQEVLEKWLATVVEGKSTTQPTTRHNGSSQAATPSPGRLTR